VEILFVAHRQFGGERRRLKMKSINRRSLLTATTAAASLTVFGSAAGAVVPAGRDPFDYEITRTDAEWHDLLGEDYAILRGGGTEVQRSSPLWAEARAGDYACRGCDLPQYKSTAKVNLLKGWVFFKGSEPNTQLMSQDDGSEMGDTPSATNFAIETHCRRCGCHMGHILLVEGQVLHCINGASLKFTTTEG
jgi:peptide-methionine (R)-S-oxide reductase